MNRTERLQKLKSLLNERVVVLDGAMGTMIQNLNLSEEDFRGERFADYHMDIKGNNDILVITKPEVIRDIHLEFLRKGAGAGSRAAGIAMAVPSGYTPRLAIGF